MPDTKKESGLIASKESVLLEDLTFLENYIRDLFSFLPLPVSLISSLGIILEANPAFEEISGYGLAELIGASVEKFFDKKSIDELYKKTVEAGSVKREEIILTSKDQQKILVSASTTLRKTDEEVIGYFIALFDLTDIKKYENELQSAKKNLETRVRELEKFEKITVNRELKMVELKKENEKLKKDLASATNKINY